MILWLTLIISAQRFFQIKNNYEWNNWKLPSNRQWTQWRCNTFQSTNIFLGFFLSNVVRVIHAKVCLYRFECLNMPQPHTLCMFYFITYGYQISMFCSLASIPWRDYEKSHQLKQWLFIGQPSLWTAVSQACPSGQIQGWYCSQSSLYTAQTTGRHLPAFTTVRAIWKMPGAVQKDCHWV